MIIKTQQCQQCEEGQTELDNCNNFIKCSFDENEGVINDDLFSRYRINGIQNNLSLDDIPFNVASNMTGTNFIAISIEVEFKSHLDRGCKINFDLNNVLSDNSILCSPDTCPQDDNKLCVSAGPINIDLFVKNLRYHKVLFYEGCKDCDTSSTIVPFDQFMFYREKSYNDFEDDDERNVGFCSGSNGYTDNGSGREVKGCGSSLDDNDNSLSQSKEAKCRINEFNLQNHCAELYIGPLIDRYMFSNTRYYDPFRPGLTCDDDGRDCSGRGEKFDDDDDDDDIGDLRNLLPITPSDIYQYFFDYKSATNDNIDNTCNPRKSNCYIGNKRESFNKNGLTYAQEVEFDGNDDDTGIARDFAYHVFEPDSLFCRVPPPLSNEHTTDYDQFYYLRQEIYDDIKDDTIPSSSDIITNALTCGYCQNNGLCRKANDGDDSDPSFLNSVRLFTTEFDPYCVVYKFDNTVFTDFDLDLTIKNTGTNEIDTYGLSVNDTLARHNGYSNTRRNTGFVINNEKIITLDDATTLDDAYALGVCGNINDYESQFIRNEGFSYTERENDCKGCTPLQQLKGDDKASLWFILNEEQYNNMTKKSCDGTPNSGSLISLQRDIYTIDDDEASVYDDDNGSNNTRFRSVTGPQTNICTDDTYTMCRANNKDNTGSYSLCYITAAFDQFRQDYLDFEQRLANGEIENETENIPKWSDYEASKFMPESFSPYPSPNIWFAAERGVYFQPNDIIEFRDTNGETHNFQFQNPFEVNITIYLNADFLNEGIPLQRVFMEKKDFNLCPVTSNCGVGFIPEQPNQCINSNPSKEICGYVDIDITLTGEEIGGTYVIKKDEERCQKFILLKNKPFVLDNEKITISLLLNRNNNDVPQIDDSCQLNIFQVLNTNIDLNSAVLSTITIDSCQDSILEDEIPTPICNLMEIPSSSDSTTPSNSISTSNTPSISVSPSNTPSNLGPTETRSSTPTPSNSPSTSILLSISDTPSVSPTPTSTFQTTFDDSNVVPEECGFCDFACDAQYGFNGFFYDSCVFLIVFFIIITITIIIGILFCIVRKKQKQD